VKSAKSSIITFDPNLRGRNEVQKNFWTPYCLTEFHGESEKYNRFSPRGTFILGQNGFFKKWLLKLFQVGH
jgi:hypothetical protein